MGALLSLFVAAVAMSIGFLPSLSSVWMAIAGLSIAGILDTIYVLRFTFRPVAVVDPEAACSLDDPGHCQELFQSSTARLLGNIPNSALGFVFYGVAGVSAVIQLAGSWLPLWWMNGLVLGAVAAVGMSIYLFCHLVFVRKTTCIPCFIGQGINVMLLILLALQAGRYRLLADLT